MTLTRKGQDGTALVAALESAVLAAMAKTLTRKGQREAFTSARLMAALESAWSAIRARHPEVPAAVLIVGSGSRSRKQVLLLGHYAASRWQVGDNRRPEIFISGEGLARPAAEVLTTLLHEAAHALAGARGIQDTSRQGRWHNRRFADLAGELGLDAGKDPKIGWSPCTIRSETIAAYAAELDELSAAIGAYRHSEATDEAKTKTKANNALECGCGRKIRASAKVRDLGPIGCGLCGQPFELVEE